MKLDPTALDAAVRAYSEKGGRVGVKHAITAYLTALAPQTQAAVFEYENTCIDYGRHGDGGDACPEFEAMDAAQIALLALLGAEETE